MIVSQIVAVSKNGVIGKDNRLLWKLYDDMKLFKQITNGHFVLMGRKTYESLGKPLPNRTNIIVSKNKDYKIEHENCFVVNSINKGIQLAKEADETELFIIGGGQVYSQTLDISDRIYRTVVDVDIEGDTFFPYNPNTKKLRTLRTDTWKRANDIKYFTANEKNQYNFSFQTFNRIKKNELKESIQKLNFSFA